MEDVLLVHYSELTLKQGNRDEYELALTRNLRESLRGLGQFHFDKLFGRLVLRSRDGQPLDFERLSAKLQDTIGISWYSRAIMVERSWENLIAATDRALPQGAPSFGVRAKRADVDWEYSKTETARRLGAHIVAKTGWKVDLKTPDLWVLVEIASGKILVATERREGRGGLPVGTSGRVVSLLSGGIDSPVATFDMMTRGCRIGVAHCHSVPFTKQRSIEKVRDLATLLSTYQPRAQLRMYSIPIAPIQQKIIDSTPAHYRVLLYRRFMLRVASVAASREKAMALVTGDVLSQVSSQTLSNLRTVEAVSKLPVLRPLLAQDKETIIARARNIGTYEISIEPHEDSCAFLLPRRPATRSTIEEAEEMESKLAVDDLVYEAIENTEIIKILNGEVLRD